MTNDFLPVGYETPETPSHYMELAEGLNSLRVLSPAIVGYEWWTETQEGERQPVRVRTEAEVPEEVRQTFDRRTRARHFWAFVVYNYDEKAIQVLVLKQQTIMGAIEALLRNPNWGDPRGYDLLIEKSHTDTRERDVEYSVMPEPKAPVDPGIEELAKQMPVNLEALYEGQDPFAGAKSDEAQPLHRQHRTLRQANGHNAHA